MKDTYPSLLDNLPAVLLTDGMPTVARYAREIDAADVHRLRLSNNLIVRPIPEADCDAMICELRPAMDPTGPEVASREARKLVDSYPAREVHNPHAYAAALTGVMAEFPPDILREMRRHLIRHLRYLPVGADVYKVASALIAKRELALLLATRHKKEHDRLRRQPEQEPLEERRAHADRIMAECRQSMGTPVGKAAAKALEDGR